MHKDIYSAVAADAETQASDADVRAQMRLAIGRRPAMDVPEEQPGAPQQIDPKTTAGR